MSTLFPYESFGAGDTVVADHIKQLFQPIKHLEEGQAFFRSDIGTTNAYKVNFDGTGTGNKNAISAYAAGQLVMFKAANANTSSSTLQVMGPSGALSAVPLVKPGNVALVADDIKADQMVLAVYNDEGYFEMVGAPATVQLSASQIGAGTVDDTEFGYLNGVTSSIQTQLNGKAGSSHTHAASDITTGTLGYARVPDWYGVVLGLSADQSLTQNAENHIQFNVEKRKSSGITHSNSTNPQRIYFDRPGLYRFSGFIAVRCATNTGNPAFIHLHLSKNGTVITYDNRAVEHTIFTDENSYSFCPEWYETVTSTTDYYSLVANIPNTARSFICYAFGTSFIAQWIAPA